MVLKSFGCSFTHGSDLKDCDLENFSPSNLTWPALLAKSLNYDYECHAHPGIGNLQIYHRVLSQVQMKDSSFFIINWTWTDRYDFLDPVYENWHTLRPDGNSKQHQIYYKHFYNQYHCMITTLSYISSTIAMLKKYNIKFIMTVMDPALFDLVDPLWQDPKSITVLQQEIDPYIVKFENQTFLEWAKEKGFPISNTLHPLEQAHEEAFKLLYKQNIIDRLRHA